MIASSWQVAGHMPSTSAQVSPNKVLNAAVHASSALTEDVLITMPLRAIGRKAVKEKRIALVGFEKYCLRRQREWKEVMLGLWE